MLFECPLPRIRGLIKLSCIAVSTLHLQQSNINKFGYSNLSPASSGKSPPPQDADSRSRSLTLYRIRKPLPGMKSKNHLVYSFLTSKKYLIPLFALPLEIECYLLHKLGLFTIKDKQQYLSNILFLPANI